LCGGGKEEELGGLSRRRRDAEGAEEEREGELGGLSRRRGDAEGAEEEGGEFCVTLMPLPHSLFSYLFPHQSWITPNFH